MPPLILAVLVGAGAYAGYRAARTLWTSLSTAPLDAGDAKAPSGEPEPAISEKDLGALEYDPATGVYRPTPRT